MEPAFDRKECGDVLNALQGTAIEPFVFFSPSRPESYLPDSDIHASESMCTELASELVLDEDTFAPGVCGKIGNPSIYHRRERNRHCYPDGDSFVPEGKIVSFII